jgi:hypothetical protein
MLMTRGELTLDMMDILPELRGSSHGGDGMISQVRRLLLRSPVVCLCRPQQGTENENSVLFLKQKKPCPILRASDKD